MSSISKEVVRRYILGRQGLWPGRRWKGEKGTAQALRYIECVQMDPLNVLGRSHDLALLSRVVDYKPEYLNTLMYHNRAFFEYGGNMRIYPVAELSYWRVTMGRTGEEKKRWARYWRIDSSLLKIVKAELRARGPLSNRDFRGEKRVGAYRGRKDSALALYYLWLTGEVMVHHRNRFERVYDFRKNIVPASLDRKARVKEAEGYFARKAFAYRGLCTTRSWARWTSFFIDRKLARKEAERWLDRMLTEGEIAQVSIEGEKEPYYLLAQDAGLLEAVDEGHVPYAWRPLDTTTQEEVVFLAPLETVIAYGRAKWLFGFEYFWEVYTPAAKRRWGYYNVPVLYGDQLVARIGPKLDRESGTLIINGFWPENDKIAKDAEFADALARGLARLMNFVNAGTIDVSVVGPPRLRRHIQKRIKEEKDG